MCVYGVLHSSQVLHLKLLEYQLWDTYVEEQTDGKKILSSSSNTRQIQ